MNLNEFEQSVNFQIVESRDKNDNVLCKLRYFFFRADWKNKNGRVYPSSVVEREVNAYQQQLMESRGTGQLEHPAGGNTALDKVSHTIDKVSYDQDSKMATAESSVLRTTRGNDLFVMLQENIEMGASTRGAGTTRKTPDAEIVCDDYRLYSIDIVSGPSFGEHTKISTKNIFESYRPAIAIDAELTYRFHESLDAGWKGSWEEFLAMCEKESNANYALIREARLAGFDICNLNDKRR